MKLTAKEFEDMAQKFPTWAGNITHVVEVTEYVRLLGSKINKLSPLLHFTGKNEDGVSATFESCFNLEVPAGTFYGGVHFKKCGLKKIDTNRLKFIEPRDASVRFENCPNLQIAEGTFPIHVDFVNCGIRSISDDFQVTKTAEGNSAYFSECHLLKIAQGTYKGAVTFVDCGIEKIDTRKFIIQANPDDNHESCNFINCFRLKVAEGNYPGRVNFINANLKQVGEFKVGGNQTAIVFSGCNFEPNTFAKTSLSTLMLIKKRGMFAKNGYEEFQKEFGKRTNLAKRRESAVEISMD